jgi:hypothetical protein
MFNKRQGPIMQQPTIDKEAVRNSINAELAALKPRLDAMEVIVSKMNTVANELHVIAHADASVSPELRIIAKAQMVLIEANLSSITFQLSDLQNRKSQLDQALINLNRQVEIPGFLTGPGRA